MLRRSIVHSLAALAALSWIVAPGPAAAEAKRWFLGGDKVYVRQHDQFVRIVEPDVHLDRARRSFVDNQLSVAADELERAAAGFAYFAARAAGASRAELEKAERGLTKLADDVRAKRIGEVTNLDRALADARRILAGEPPPDAHAAPPAPR